MNSMIRSLLLIGTTGFWLTMMSLLIEKEFFQITPIQAAYKILPLTSGSLREEHQAVYLKDERIGLHFVRLKGLEGKTQEEGKPEVAGAAYKLETHSYLTLQMLGRRNEILVQEEAWLDERLYLKAFGAHVKTKDYWTNIQGQITHHAVEVVIEDKGSEPVRKTFLAEGPVFFSESIDILWTPKNLVTGKRGLIRLWNPLLFDVEEVHFLVKGKEDLFYRGSEIKTYIIELTQGEIKTRSWVTPEGVTLRRESPVGLTMQREPAWEIYDAFREKSREQAPDLPNLFSIPSPVTWDHPEALTYLRAKVRFLEKEKIFEIRKESLAELESVKRPLDVPGEDFAPYLAATEWIQVQDPMIRKTASEIAGREKSVLRASLLIMDWVHQNLTPVPTVSIPSARQVLSVRRGDCNEYTALFTALTRSLGIPTRMMAGLVYQNGRFFYHAWPEVYAGRWIPLDPTFHQAPTDVTHIPLVEGGLQQQVPLAGKLGDIKITVEESY